MTISTFFMRRRSFQDHWIGWPWHLSCSVSWWLWKKFKLRDRSCFLTIGSSNAITACVTATDHNYMFPGGENVFGIRWQITYSPVLLCQEIHSKMNSFQISSGDIEISWNG